MPIELITGLPGNGKTAYTMSRLLDLEKQKSKRKIYIVGIKFIKELKLDIEFIDYDRVSDWVSFDTGALIIIDEAQEVFPQRMKGNAPDFITELSTHRHYGFDFWLITQDPRLLDAWARRLVGTHEHIKRLWGTNWQVIFRWDKATDNPRDGRDQKTASKRVAKLPKKVYGLYKSAEEHNVKSNIPVSLIFASLSIPLFVFFAYYAFTNFNLLDDEQTELQYQSEKPFKAVTNSKNIPDLPKEKILDFIDNKFVLNDLIILGKYIHANLTMTDIQAGTQHEITLSDFRYESGLIFRVVSPKKMILYQNGKTKSLYRVKASQPRNKYKQRKDVFSSSLPPNPFTTQQTR